MWDAGLLSEEADEQFENVVWQFYCVCRGEAAGRMLDGGGAINYYGVFVWVWVACCVRVTEAGGNKY